MKINKLIYQLNRFRLDQTLGFGLVESVLSVLFLFTITTYSLYFISKRHSIIYNSNLNNAINDEIRRDIERLKADLWSKNYKEPNNQEPAYYSVDSGLSLNYYCGDIIRLIRELPSWEPTSWEPGSNKNSLTGQVRNKVLRGKPLTISRYIATERPLGIGSDNTVDRSLAKIVYKVKSTNFVRNWTTINLSSEAHSWCPPR